MFGKIHRGRKVELTCPNCGATQQEPSLVISSFCRHCGEYFRVRKGVAVANPGIRVSGIAELMPRERRRHLGEVNPIAPGPVGESWLVSAGDGVGRPRPIPRSEEPGTGSTDISDISAGTFFGLVDESELERFEAESAEHPMIGLGAHGREALAHGSMAALIGANRTVVIAGKEKMPPDYAPPDVRRRDESAGEIPVRCHRCHHVQDVSRHAKSTQCARCSAYISLANYEIRTIKRLTLRTRGDIEIAGRGGLVNRSEIACHHLIVNGPIDATVDCSGDAVFRHSGTVRGRLHCDELIIGKRCEVRFPDGVVANRAEVAGHLIGDLTCSGMVRVRRTGLIEGDLDAVALELKDGGRISGEAKLDPATGTTSPDRGGFNPTVID
jgi:cytoskeletal protein CcmA (bactofilin family)